MKKYLYILLLAIFIASTAFIFGKIDFRKGRNNNVCKSLKGNVLVYAIFVDTKTTSPWTEFDIQSTMDSIYVATSWIEEQAKKSGVQLGIKTDFYVGTEYSTVSRDLPEGSIRKSITSPSLGKGIENMNLWADNIAKKVGGSFNISEKDGVREIKNPKNKERLVAYLRDEHKVESIALMFMVNNYYRDDISCVVNGMSSEDVEFAVVSYKYPSEIAHNILQLFGSADLHESIFRNSDKAINYALQEFPNDIMQYPYAKQLNTLEIGAFTKYMIGWTDTISNDYEFLLNEKGVRL